MRRLLLLLMICSVGFSGKSQESDTNYVVGIEFGTMQYAGEFASEFWQLKNLNGAIGISLTKRLNKSFDFFGQFSHGIINYSYLQNENDTINWSFSTAIYNLDLGFRFKLNNGTIMPQDIPVSPYVYLGFGNAVTIADHYSLGWDMAFNIPVGWGIDYRINDNWRAGIFSIYHWAFSDNYDGWDRSKDGATGNLMDRFMLTGFSLKYSLNPKTED